MTSTRGHAHPFPGSLCLLSAPLFPIFFCPPILENFAGAALGRVGSSAAVPEYPVRAPGAIKGSGMDRERREFARTAPRRSRAGENPPRPQCPTSFSGGGTAAPLDLRGFFWVWGWFFSLSSLSSHAAIPGSGCSQPGGEWEEKGMLGGFGKIRSFSSRAPPGAAAREL